MENKIKNMKRRINEINFLLKREEINDKIIMNRKIRRINELNLWIENDY